MPEEPAEGGIPQPPGEFPTLSGEVAALLRTIDWSTTSLGPVSTWPRSLKTMIGVMLGSRFPMMLGWGSSMIQFYNDAYVPVLGVKHPSSLGAPVAQVWSEIWDVVGPLMHSVLAGGPALWREHQLLFINSRGFAQETFHTFSQSPVPDDHGGVGGVLLTVQETTEQVQGERQLEVLRALAERSSYATSMTEASEFAATILRAADADVPFAFIYLLSADGTEARLTASSSWPVPEDIPGLVPLETSSPADECWTFPRGAGVVQGATHRRPEEPLRPHAGRAVWHGAREGDGHSAVAGREGALRVPGAGAQSLASRQRAVQELPEAPGRPAHLGAVEGALGGGRAPAHRGDGGARSAPRRSSSAT